MRRGLHAHWVDFRKGLREMGVENAFLSDGGEVDEVSGLIQVEAIETDYELSHHPVAIEDPAELKGERARRVRRAAGEHINIQIKFNSQGGGKAIAPRGLKY